MDYSLGLNCKRGTVATKRPIRLVSRRLKFYAGNFATVEAAVCYLIRTPTMQKRLLDGDLFHIYRNKTLLASVKLRMHKFNPHAMYAALNTIMIIRWNSWR